VNCAGCGRRLGIAPTYRRVFRVMFCDDYCWNLPPIPEIENESRDRLVRTLAQDAGLTQHKLAEVFGISRSRVGQILASGNGDGRTEAMSDDVRQTKSRAGKAAASKRWGNSTE
jgi:hypothetical protein